MGRTVHGLEPSDPAMASTFLEREFTAADIPTTWKPEVLAESLLTREPSLNWYDVVQSLDFPGFCVKDANGLKIIVNAVKKALQAKDQSSTFPVDRLLQRWNNREGQFSIMDVALHNPEIIPFGEVECQQVHINVLKNPPDEQDRQVANWRSINLMEALLNLGEDPSVREGVKELIKIGMTNCPDVIILSLAQAQTQWTPLRKELLDTLIYRYFQSSVANSTSVLVYVWNNCGHQPQIRHLLMASLKAYYKEHPTDQNRLARIIEIAHEIKALKNLIKITNEDDFNFGIDLAILASRRNYVNLKMWFDENAQNRIFIDELIKYYTSAKRISLSADVQKIIDDTIRPFAQGSTGTLAPPPMQGLGPITSGHEDLGSRFSGLQLNPNVSLPSGPLDGLPNFRPSGFPPGGVSQPNFDPNPTSLFQTLTNTSQGSTISPTTVPGLPNYDLLRQGGFASNGPPPGTGFSAIPSANPGLSGNPALSAFNPPNTPYALFNDRPDAYRDHIDSLFKELFEKSITPEKFVDQVKRMKQNPGQQKEFKFVLENLVQEFKHLHKFPADPLEITAHVWGKVLAEELLEETTYCEKFLKKVLEALQQGMSSTAGPGYEKMFVFGETVLQQFILKDPRVLKKKTIYKTFCEKMVQSSWFQMGGDKRLQPPKLVYLIKEIGESHQPPSSHDTSQKISIAIKPTINGKIQPRPDIIEPPEEIQDRIGFIYNNLSINNLKHKSKEMREALETNPDFFIWLANYIVVKRVLKEENFLQIYAEVVEELRNRIYYLL